MKAAAVGLHDQPCITPEEVGLEQAMVDAERNVDLGRWESALAAHAKERTLQFTASPLGLRMNFIEDETKPRDTAPATATSEQSAQGKLVNDPQHLSLAERLPQLPDRNDCG